MEKEILTLRDLQALIRVDLEESFPGRVWIRAEISSIGVKGGNCYLELVQSEGGVAVAKVRAMIWRSRYPALSQFFQAATGTPLKAGMELLWKVQVNYSELYGLSLIVDDIEAQSVLGEQELRRRQTVARLETEGLMDRQGELALPLLPSRLAVVSAPTAAGFGDFCAHLESNVYGFAFEVELFEATMQGESAPASIVDAIERVQTCGRSFDLLLILRGGGSDFDLSCFDDYGLCVSIADCALPVFTAIGHERDRHVADMVAARSVKTPTALADELIECFAAEDERISSYATRLRLAFASKLAAMSSRVDLLEARIKAADPRVILSRGYSLAVDGQGVVLRSVAGIGEGGRMDVLFADGRAECVVQKVEYVDR